MFAPFVQLGTFHFESTRFTGENFERWEEKIEFTLKQLNIYYVLTNTPPLIPSKDEATLDEINATLETKKNWDAADYKCRHMILEMLSDSLFNQFVKKTKIAKELWEAVVKVYKDIAIGSKKFNVQSYREFKMVDSKLILE